jgi:hypothetical protein
LSPPFFQQIGKFVFFHVEGEGTLVNQVYSGKPLTSAEISWKKNIASYGYHPALFNYSNEREMKMMA